MSISIPAHGVLAYGLGLVVLAALFAKVSVIAPSHPYCTSHIAQVEVYMDEIFHVPQAIAYARLRFAHYDPSITTFPGVYLLAAFAYRLFGLPLGLTLDVHFLRMINIILASALLETLARLRRRLLPQEEPSLPSLVLATFPVSFFFYFLFYTDTASTLFVCLTYLVSLSHPSGLPAPSLGFHLLLLSVRSPTCCRHSQHIHNSSVHWPSSCGKRMSCGCSSSWASAARRLWPAADCSGESPPATSIPTIIGRFRDTWDDFPGNIFSFLVQFIRHLPRLLSRHLSLFVAPVVFAVFLVLNKGVVLGKATDEVLHLNLRRG